MSGLNKVTADLEKANQDGTTAPHSVEPELQRGLMEWSQKQCTVSQAGNQVAGNGEIQLLEKTETMQPKQHQVRLLGTGPCPVIWSKDAECEM